MSNIKDQIVTLLKQRHHSHKVALEQEKDPRSKHAVDLIARIREDSRLIEVIDSLPEEKPSEDLEEADEKTCYNCKWRWGDMCYAIRGVRLRLYDPVHPTTCKSWRASDATRRK